MRGVPTAHIGASASRGTFYLVLCLGLTLLFLRRSVWLLQVILFHGLSFRSGWLLLLPLLHCFQCLM